MLSRTLYTWLASLFGVLVAGCLLAAAGSAWAQAQKDVPNIFTPNGDGTNDYLVLEGAKAITLSVFNRNGVLVYQTQGLLIKWDGKDHLGRDLADGVYFYKLDDPNGVYKHRKGTLCISRSSMRKKA